MVATRTKKKASRRSGSKSPYEVQYFLGLGDQPFFARLVSSKNGKVIAASEGYSTKAARAGTWKKLADQLKCEITTIAAPEPSEPVPASVESESDLSDDLE